MAQQACAPVDDAPEVVGEAWETTPATREELASWVREVLGVGVVSRAIRMGGDSPMDYLAHAFFAGVRRAEGPPQPKEAGLDSVVWAHRGGGKTYLGALATALDMVFRPGIEVRILGGSLEQSRRMHAHLRGFFASGGRLHGLVSKDVERGLTLRNASRVEILAQSEKSVRGTRVQRLRCDEVDLFKPEVWEAAQLVTRSKVCGAWHVSGSVECLSTMHVPVGIMERVVDECAGGTRRLFSWGVIDSLERCGEEHACAAAEGACVLWEECGGRAKDAAREGGHVSVADAMRMKGRVSLRVWRSEMRCERPRREGAVLEEFDSATHVVRGDPDASLVREWVYGMDFGFRAPTVVLVGAVVGRSDGQEALWIVDERVEEGVVLGEHAREIAGGLSRWPTCAWIGVDPAGHARNDQTGKSAVGVLREAGLVVKTARLSVEAGLGLVRARLCPADARIGPRLMVHARCERLIESLRHYRYGTGEMRHVPIKDGHDHAVDALRYLVTNLDRRAGAGLRWY